jgi:hypothetical protein
MTKTTETNQNEVTPWKEQFSMVFTKQIAIAPLVILRIIFGAIMFISTLRFISKGWIEAYYIKPVYHFTYYGFEWVKPFGATTMYLLFYIMALAAVLVMSGLFYRLAITVFFICFTYVELIDKTTYLNHYYFVSIVSFLLILVPANRHFSLDVWRKPTLKATTVPAWCILIFQGQLFLVYFFAGISKINHDWLMDAMPLKIWLPAQDHLPVIGFLFSKQWVAYVFSWGGLIFDLFIGFILFNKKTVYYGYILVVIFHGFTALLFPIGMFPYIMMSTTWIFFQEDIHKSIIRGIKKVVSQKESLKKEAIIPYEMTAQMRQAMYGLLIIYFVIQVILPLRYLLYPGPLFWTEEGFRYSWRVMLMEKTGVTFFYVKDLDKGTEREVPNFVYLTPFQEKMMCTQPDMILQYAHFLGETYHDKQGVIHPAVTVKSFVTLNGSKSQPFIDKQVNLLKESESFSHKAWILPFVHPKFARCE